MLSSCRKSINSLQLILVINEHKHSWNQIEDRFLVTRLLGEIKMLLSLS